MIIKIIYETKTTKLLMHKSNLDIYTTNKQAKNKKVNKTHKIKTYKSKKQNGGGGGH